MNVQQAKQCSVELLYYPVKNRVNEQGSSEESNKALSIEMTTYIHCHKILRSLR